MKRGPSWALAILTLALVACGSNGASDTETLPTLAPTTEATSPPAADADDVSDIDVSARADERDRMVREQIEARQEMRMGWVTLGLIVISIFFFAITDMGRDMSTIGFKPDASRPKISTGVRVRTRRPRKWANRIPTIAPASETNSDSVRSS